MDTTPNKHYEILPIDGDAYTIEQGGLAIESLGDQMLAAADLLDSIALGAECRGKSLDDLKDNANEVKSDLRRAGERYQPSGTAILNYGRALHGVQARLSTIVPQAEQNWQAYQTKQQRYQELNPPLIGGGEAPQGPLSTPADAGQPGEVTSGDVQAAYNEWVGSATAYESAYDDWWGAYEEARLGVQQANDRGVEDSFWDDALPFLEVLGTILSYAGIVLAVLACIIGGPFILAAALVGLAALAVTVWKVSRGRGGTLDIVMAAIGVFPFGKAAGLFSAMRAAPTFSTLFRGLGGMGGEMLGLGAGNITRLSGVLGRGRFAEVFHGSGGLNRNGSAVLSNFFGNVGSPSVITRLLRGQEGAWSAHLSEGALQLSNKARQNLSQFLGNTPNGSVMQDMLEGSNAVLDFVDGMGKSLLGFGYDRATGGW